MADFGFLSDTDDSAVDELISQTQELCVLEQVSKINSSGFTDSLLPADLETRFHKLKSFPLSKSKTPAVSRSNTDLNNISVRGRKHDDASLSDREKGGNLNSSNKQDPDGKMGFLKGGKEVFLDDPEGKVGLEKELIKSGYVSSPPSKSSSMEEGIFTPKKGNRDGKGGLKKMQKKSSLQGSDYSNSWVEDSIFSSSKQRSEKKIGMKSKSGSSNSSNSFVDSPSPPKKSGCFWCSLKRVTKKQSKENLSLDWGKDNFREFLSDLSTFSVKEQQKRLKKAVKEQDRMSKEAEKIVKWAKQASARMSFHGIDDDELSDDVISK